MTDKLKDDTTTALLSRSKKLRGEMDGSMARLDRQCVTVMFQMEETIARVLAERDALSKDAARWAFYRDKAGPDAPNPFWCLRVIEGEVDRLANEAMKEHTP